MIDFQEIKKELVKINDQYTNGLIDPLFGKLREYEDLTQKDILFECSVFMEPTSGPAYYQALVRFVESCFQFRIDLEEFE